MTTLDCKSSAFSNKIFCRPWTRQSQGCGQPGDHISLPAQFVSSWNSSGHDEASSGKLLAHEFIKLRFGIFDDIGFPGDPLYPSQFDKDGQVLATSVSDASVQGSWVHGTTGHSHCQHSANSTCVFHPSGPNNHVSCSLGSYPLLPRVNRYCRGQEIGQSPGPTKQRRMCGGRNAWEVISAI